MNAIEIERNKMFREQINNDLKIIKLKDEKRKINENKLEEDLGIQKSLFEFHKPVIDKIEDQNVTRKQNLNKLQLAIKDVADNVSNISFEVHDPAEDVKAIMDKAEQMKMKYELNKELDLNFIKSEGFELPTELINKSEKELENIIKNDKTIRDKYKLLKANLTRNRNYESNKDNKHKIQNDIDIVHYKMEEMKKYIKVLKLILDSSDYRGEGLDDKLNFLSQLTDKICKGSKCKKSIQSSSCYIRYAFKRRNYN